MTRNGATAVAAEATVTFRTSVGDFIFRRAEFDWRLEIKAVKVRRVLGDYETDDAACILAGLIEPVRTKGAGARSTMQRRRGESLARLVSLIGARSPWVLKVTSHSYWSDQDRPFARGQWPAWPARNLQAGGT